MPPCARIDETVERRVARGARLFEVAGCACEGVTGGIGAVGVVNMIGLSDGLGLCAPQVGRRSAVKTLKQQSVALDEGVGRALAVRRCGSRANSV